MCARLLQSFLTLYKPVDCSLPGFSVHGILQVRTLEWIAMAIFQTQRLILDLLHG